MNSDFEFLEEIKEAPDDNVTNEDDTTYDTQLILCPDNRVTRLVNMLGVVAAYHEDDNSSCTFMNTLDRKVTDILARMLQTMEFEESPKMKAILATSEQAREQFYIRLSSMKGKDLSRALTKLVKMYIASPHANGLLQSLVNTFDNTCTHNIQMCTGKDVSKFKTNPKEHLLTMERLTIHDVESIISIEIPTEKPQTFEEIFGNFFPG